MADVVLSKSRTHYVYLDSSNGKIVYPSSLNQAGTHGYCAYPDDEVHIEVLTRTPENLCRVIPCDSPGFQWLGVAPRDNGVSLHRYRVTGELTLPHERSLNLFWGSGDDSRPIQLQIMRQVRTTGRPLTVEAALCEALNDADYLRAAWLIHEYQLPRPGETALWETLISRAESNSRDSEGYTLLMRVAANGDEEMVKVLLRRVETDSRLMLPDGHTKAENLTREAGYPELALMIHTHAALLAYAETRQILVKGDVALVPRFMNWLYH